MTEQQPTSDERSTPGEVITPDGDIELNQGRSKVALEVLNTGDRAIQVASHFHFFEANKALAFDRAQALGMRLDVPAGKLPVVKAARRRRSDLQAGAIRLRAVVAHALAIGADRQQP